MSSSLVDIFNLALATVGSTQLVASATEASLEASTCNNFYPMCRDYVLRDYPWRFAKRRVPLALKVGATVVAETAWVTATAYTAGTNVSNSGYNYTCAISHTSGTFATDLAAEKWVLTTTVGALTAPDHWAYMYSKPVDCLRLRYLSVAGVRVPAVPSRHPFELATDGETQVIFTDLEDAVATYTQSITDTTRFDPDFVSALTFYLAFRLALPLRGKPDIGKMMLEAYQGEVQRAFSASMAEGMDDQAEDSFLTARERNG
jgi:hypothetical protein